MEEDEKDKTSEELNQMVKTTAARLMEHFDSVYIFVTKKVSDGYTFGTSHGAGNYYANYGQLKRRVIMLEEEWKQDQRLSSNESEDE